MGTIYINLVTGIHYGSSQLAAGLLYTENRLEPAAEKGLTFRNIMKFILEAKTWTEVIKVVRNVYEQLRLEEFRKKIWALLLFACIQER